MNSEIKPERRRWFILAAYSLFSFANAMSWDTFSLIYRETEAYYGIGTTAFLQLFNVYLYAYIIFSISFSVYVSTHFTTSILIASLSNTLGGILRWVAKTNFSIAIVGQLFAAIAQGCVLQLPGVIAERWFPSKEHTWAVLIGSYANYLGWAYGNISSCLYLSSLPIDRAFPKMLFDQMMIMIAPTVALVLVVRNQPAKPPSAAALAKMQEPKHNFFVVMRQLIRNRKYLLNMLSVGFATGLSYALSSLTSYILEPRNFSNLQFAYIGIAFLITGTAGAFAATLYLEVKKSKSYDLILRILLVIGFCGMVGLAIGVKLAPYGVIVFLNAVIGIGYISFTPMAVESLIETSFPLPESISIGNMMIFAQIVGLVLNQISTLPVFGSNSYWVLVVAGVPITLYLIFGYKTIFNREEQEKAAHNRRQDTHGDAHNLQLELQSEENNNHQQNIQSEPET